MAIIKTIKETATIDAFRWQYPDQLVSDKEKNKDDWWKQNMDFWYTKALAQYSKNSETFVRNYKLMKGFLDKTDFYQEEKVRISAEAQDLMDTLENDLDLPSYVKHYPILNPPINTMVGEMSKRPDNAHVKAFDEDSQSEQLQAMTDMYQMYMEQLIRQKVTAKLEQAGEPVEDLEAQQEQIEQVTQEEMLKYRSSYTSVAEKWGAKMLEALKMNFNIKEKSEDGFRDMLICAREFYHIYPDGSKLGFTCALENPKNVWFLTTDDKKYTRDAYAAGTIHVMELSEILNKYPFLTDEEIRHLNKKSRDSYRYPEMYTSPLVQSNPKTGIESIEYHPYDPLVVQRRMEIEAGMMRDALDEHMGLAQSTAYWGDKFIVVKSYWQSKKKVGKLTYFDEDGVPQIIPVDENYKKIPEEISVEWGWVNQWYEGLRIGDEIYYVNPLEILDYCPIIGVVHENKNTQAASLVDLMKPYQMIYNVCMNQLWQLLPKEKGKVMLMNIRGVPTPKDGDNQDALDVWELEAAERGVIFVDDSPENMKGSSGFNQYNVVDWTLTQQMQSRFEIAQALKLECWELVGLTRQRLGSTTSSETATSIDTAMQQSYAQTETYFVAHEYLFQQVYQAMLDAAMFIELDKPDSTVSFINSEGNSVFGQINRQDLSMRDLQVFITSRGKDQQTFMELKGLARDMVQNGAGMDVIVDMYTTQSVRALQESVRSFQKKRDALEAQQNQLKQQELEQRQQQFEMQTQQADADRQELIENENYNKELDRINKKEIAIISAMGFGNVAGEDADGDGVPDLYEVQTLQQGADKLRQDQQIAVQKLQLDAQKQVSANAMQQQQIEIAKEKIKAERERTKSQEKIAKIKAVQKPKTPKKK